ncbi:MAG: UDP-N-acetylglucosamine--N-acetylmuramyl-(pentapeptide) pyrophosphoryl-undecaprenol N-acetylglucosamine transferase [Ruminococcus sp.]|nr:UDP-N-acetylglucosamine--N-acetylmuramyl-(pentapeptide) pyrophosphoryl-undecaprenol N-acetylglucosamine transferase [Ruminococcus sp.]
MLKVLLAGGGTAGHINPALAIAEIIKAHCPDAEFCFAGNPKKLEAKLVPQAGYRFEPINIEGMQRHISPENIKRNVVAMHYLIHSGRRAGQIIKDFKPDLVVGTGGYVSAPIVRKAQKMGIPTAIHEANAFAGVTTKLLSKRADVIMLTVENTKNLDESVKDRVKITGLPVRRAFEHKTKAEARAELGFSQDDIVILSAGGSLGSKTLNETVAGLLKWYQDNGKDICHIHSYGTYIDYKNYIEELEEKGVKIRDNKRLIIQEYVNMPLALAACDLVISRCGASTLTEIEAVGRGAILIPSPMVAENHQYHNGMVLQNAGAGFVYEEKDLGPTTVIDKVDELTSDRAKLEELSANAASLHIGDTNDRIFEAIRPLIENKMK